MLAIPPVKDRLVDRAGTELRWYRVARTRITMLTGKTRLAAVRRDARNFCRR